MILGMIRYQSETAVSCSLLLRSRQRGAPAPPLALGLNRRSSSPQGVTLGPVGLAVVDGHELVAAEDAGAVLAVVIEHKDVRDRSEDLVGNFVDATRLPVDRDLFVVVGWHWTLSHGAARLEGDRAASRGGSWRESSRPLGSRSGRRVDRGLGTSVDSCFLPCQLCWP